MKRNNGIINTDNLEDVLNEIINNIRDKNDIQDNRIRNMLEYELRQGVLKNSKLDDIVILKNLINISMNELLENKLYNNLINNNVKTIIYNDKRNILYKNINVVVNVSAELNINTNYSVVKKVDPIYGDLTEIELIPNISHPVKHINYELNMFIYKNSKHKVTKKKTLEIPETIIVKNEKEALELMKNVYELNINTIFMDETLMIEEKHKLIN